VDFNTNDDPYGEHDFGSFELAGEKFFWKIDYYDSLCEFGSEDPGDPEKTTRVLSCLQVSRRRRPNVDGRPRGDRSYRHP
jgi:uncharacterized protein DUF3768